MTSRNLDAGPGSGPRDLILQVLAGLGDPGGAEGLTAAELGARLGLHPTTIRFHTNRLRVAGLVSQRDVRHRGAGRPTRKYTLATPTALTSVPPPSRGTAFGVGSPEQDPHELLAQVLVRAAGTDELTPAQAGRAWATEQAEADDSSWAQATSTVAELLTKWGYDVTMARSDDEAVEVTFAGCPFGSLARENPQVVCGIHHGLIEGSLTAAGHPEAQVRLVPFATDSTCRARLACPQE
ncbi:putative ArsR family transcriptional regulator [Kineosphaera limosa]|uniref:Putative SufR family transcriptional regulator n=1 Tax=Kineosphaera limosa NBRC 100340 TaxID=1184609 RepID=K6WGC0_9MICO|nr:transcriptional regulator [Kineosphaera limosa]NYE00962.1 putative ArsR family transcriptional regulator [Kineosphaera limosa]GAB98310.1 putative SufR family transcriptional regulator [Kineosphaera limosa NBRC 100340]